MTRHQLRKFILSLFLVILGSTMFFTSISFSNTGPNNVLFILDASQLMINNIDDEPRITYVKRVLHEAINLYTGFRIGVMVYGHKYDRYSNLNCKTIELIVPLALYYRQDAVFVNEVLDKLDNIKTRGVSPISEAFKQAEAVLPKSENNVIVLISSGPESADCKVDACAAAADLKTKGLVKRIDVLGLEIKEADQKALSCIAENTGGRFANSENKYHFQSMFEDILNHVKSGNFDYETTPKATTSTITNNLTDPYPYVTYRTTTTIKRIPIEMQTTTTTNILNTFKMTMNTIPGGRFKMGSSAGASDQRDEHYVIVQDFLMDTKEVTVQEFYKFVQETGYRTDAERKGKSEGFDGKVWKEVDGLTWYKPSITKEYNIKDLMDYPVVHISFNDAFAYATWAKKRLPTESEFEYAAKSGRNKRLFPWGDTFVKEKVNALGNDVALDKMVDFFKGRGLMPGGSFEANVLGIYDLSGNAMEWTLSAYRAYPYSPRDGRNSIEFDQLRVLRGGSWMTNIEDKLTTVYRDFAEQDFSSAFTGFRCVASAQ